MSVKCVQFVYAVVALTAVGFAAPSLPTAAVDNAASEDIGPPLNVAQCRAQCLQRVSSNSGPISHSVTNRLPRTQKHVGRKCSKIFQLVVFLK